RAVEALGRPPGPAVRARAVGDGARADDAVAGAEAPDLAPGLGDDADELVPEDRPVLEARRVPVVGEEVGAADGAAPHLDARVGRRVEPWVGHGLDAEVARPVENDRLHGCLRLCPERPRPVSDT